MLIAYLSSNKDEQIRTSFRDCLLAYLLIVSLEEFTNQILLVVIQVILANISKNQGASSMLLNLQ